MTDLFTIVHPPMPLTFDAILDFINAAYVIGLKADDHVMGQQNHVTGTEVEKRGRQEFRLLIRGEEGGREREREN